MFQKNSSKPTSEEANGTSKKERSEPTPKNDKSPKRSGGTNVILSDVEITGTVRFKNDVVIDGRIEGEIFSDGSVTIGEKATVDAEIRSKTVIVEGCVKGDIYASDRLELKEHAQVTGDIKAAVLTMQAGAILVGSSSVGAAPDMNAPAKPKAERKEAKREQSNARQERELAHA